MYFLYFLLPASLFFPVSLIPHNMILIPYLCKNKQTVMQFRTELILPKAVRPIGYADRMLLLGSCFSENIGIWLSDHYMDVVVNPFGILYNPASIAHSLRMLTDEKTYTTADLFEHQGVYRSFDHHSRFSAPTAAETLQLINDSRESATRQLREADLLLITFGTAWIYTLKESGRTVSNCHKLPERLFERRKLSVGEIVSEWSALIGQLTALNPKLQVIFTVSPIRHIKDTLHGNQLSKATLLLAIEELQHAYKQVSYFPAYELMIDDLRDYRFCAADMVHPSDTAVSYIQSKFAGVYFDRNTENLFAACEKFKRALDHKPSDPDSAEYQKFLTQNIQKLNQLIDKNTFFTLRKPLQQFQERLK